MKDVSCPDTMHRIFLEASQLIDTQSATSELGVFVRRALLEYRKASFDYLCKLHEALVQH
ncbi:hypothetical protein HDU67_006048, partial [Dinochytrium kinnereticum]